VFCRERLQEVIMFRGAAAVLAAAGVAALVTGCGGGQASSPAAQTSPHAARSTHASLTAKGAALVCDRLRPVAAQIAALKRPDFGELEHYSSVLAGLAQQAYQGPGGNTVMANALNQAAMFIGERAISGPGHFLNLSQYQVRQIMRSCPPPRPGHDRD
jgi:hypothetical protein